MPHPANRKKSEVSDRSRNYFLDSPDARLVSPVERPLSDALRANQVGLLQYLHVFAGSGLADAQLPGDKHATNAILDEIAVNLRRKMFPRILQPCENLQPSRIGKRGKRSFEIHIDN